MSLTGWWPVVIVALLIVAALVWSIWNEHRTWLNDEEEDQP